MANCILYLRKSNEDVKGNDFDIQEMVCRQYADEKGYTVVGVYKEAHSGKYSPLTRNLLRQAMNDIAEHRAEVMVIRMFDRLARTIEQMYALLFQIESIYHGRVEAAQGGIDRTSKSARIHLAVAALAAEIERDNIYERTQHGKRQRAVNGKLLGAPNALYGYQWRDPEKGQRTAYDLDPVTSPIVQGMFERAAAGQSLFSITRWLNEERIPPPSVYANRGAPAKAWGRDSVRAILKNPAYCGRIVAFRHRYDREYKDGMERLVRVESENTVPLPAGVCPPIVTEAQFQLVQRGFAMNTAGRKPSDPTIGLLRGRVFCGVCKSPMYIVKNGGGYSYACSHRPNVSMDPAAACPGGNFGMRVDMVNEEGWNGVKHEMANREEFTRLLKEQAHSQPQEDLTAFAESAQGALKQAVDEQKNLAKSLALTHDDVTRKVLTGELERIANEVVKLQAQADSAQKQLDDLVVKDMAIDLVLDGIYNWGQEGEQDYDALPIELKRRGVVASKVRVYIFPKGWMIDGEPAPRILVLFGVELPTTTGDGIMRTTLWRP